MQSLTKPLDPVNYGLAIPWERLARHLQFKFKEEMSRLRSAGSTEELHKIRGALEVIENLLNLPGTLTFIDTEQFDGPSNDR